MKLHANAALSLKGRRELCRRVVTGQRTVSEAKFESDRRRDADLEAQGFQITHPLLEDVQLDS